MAGNELRAFLYGVDAEYEQHADSIFAAGFRNKRELREATPEDANDLIQTYRVPRGAVRTLIAAAREDRAPRSSGETFKMLLEQSAITPQDSVLDYMAVYCAAQMAAVSTPSGARLLYQHASALPHTRTRQRMRDTADIVFDGPFHASATRSTFLHAIKGSVPKVFKIPSEAGVAEAEYAAWSATQPFPGSCCIVGPLELVNTTEGMCHSSSLGGAAQQQQQQQGHEGTQRIGLLMPPYVMTAQQVASLKEDVAATYAERLSMALDAVHSAGYVHCDVKPSNIFLDAAGHCFLGDFGAAVKRGELVKEWTPMFLPAELAEPNAAEPMLDKVSLATILLLGVQLLPRSRSEGSVWGMGVPERFTMHGLRAAAAQVQHPQLKSCLEELLEGAPGR